MRVCGRQEERRTGGTRVGITCIARSFAESIGQAYKAPRRLLGSTFFADLFICGTRFRVQTTPTRAASETERARFEHEHQGPVIYSYCKRRWAVV